jgi:cytosine/adenosine deaminase-related metal-dependent hydrolase
MCRNPLTALMLIASPFLASLATAQSAATNETVVSQDVRVIDGTGEPPLEHATIVIEGPRIVSVGPANKLHWPKSARLINYSGKTVLPGLISDHSHVGQVDGVSSAHRITIGQTFCASCCNTKPTASRP